MIRRITREARYLADLTARTALILAVFFGAYIGLVATVGALR